MNLLVVISEAKLMCIQAIIIFQEAGKFLMIEFFYNFAYVG